MKHIIGVAQNGAEVYVDLSSPKVGRRVSRQPQLLTFAKDMLAEVSLTGQNIRMEYDMQQQIGYSFITNTESEEAVFYACLEHDDVYTRFVKTGEPTPTNYLTVIMRQDDDKNYELSDIWIGRLTPSRPGSADETAESRSYWSDHAFILGDQPIQTKTLAKICPY